MDAGQKLGKYELLEMVGKGAMGVVFRARDRARPYISDVNLRPGDRLRIQYKAR
jgi:hypothetical protein